MTDRAATFLFADIAGFTALTEAHGDEEAATLVTEFCEAVGAELPAGAATAPQQSASDSITEAPSNATATTSERR
ncbi:MAG TPA: hypothetical protein VNC17_12665 [Thermoleophilaceae bacterium]|jgi:class 3 adenylate cyclase|nr:hypothetical protein [Thermoleophilaceae bacterium]